MILLNHSGAKRFRLNHRTEAHLTQMILTKRKAFLWNTLLLNYERVI